jgi:hypothetical protein
MTKINTLKIMVRQIAHSKYTMDLIMLNDWIV